MGETYRGKRVLVTGHTGFKGSWLALWLHKLGANVAGYSLSIPTDPSLFETLRLGKKIDDIRGDIRDAEKIEKVFKKFRPQVVFHLAAQPLVGISYKEPKTTYETNIMGTVNVLEAVRTTESARAVVNVTSDKCYENKEWPHGYRESDPMGGYDPYSSSKGCAELVTSSYRSSFFNPESYGKTHRVALASARAGNVIGGGDWAEDRLIPDCVRALTGKTGKKGEGQIHLRCPKATRPWQFVLEPLSGYLLLGAMLLKDPKGYSEGWNFGPDEEDALKVEEVVKAFIGYWGSGKYSKDRKEKPHEAQMLKLDTGKARHRLGWKPVYKAREAVEKTVSLYKAYYGGGDMFDAASKQIDEYTEAAIGRGIWAKG